MGQQGCAGHMEAMWCHVEWTVKLARHRGFGLSLQGLQVPTVLHRALQDAPRVASNFDCLALSLARCPWT